MSGNLSAVGASSGNQGVLNTYWTSGNSSLATQNNSTVTPPVILPSAPAATVNLSAAATVPTTTTTLGANIVQNGDFSASNFGTAAFFGDYSVTRSLSGGSLNGWQINGAVQGNGVGYAANTSQEIDLSGAIDKNGNSGITQTLNTVAGQTYRVSFDVYTGGGINSGQGAAVNVKFGGNSLASNLTGGNFSTDPNNGRTTYSYDVTATGNSTDLSFGWNGVGSFAQISKVSVQAVNNTPTPATTPTTPVDLSSTAINPTTGVVDLRGYTGGVQASFAITRDPLETFNNTAGLYRVDDTSGGIDVSGNGTNILHPGDAGYTVAALSRSVVNFAGTDTTAKANLQGGGIYASYLIANDTLVNAQANPASTTVYFGSQNANPDNQQHLQVSGNTYHYEDSTNFNYTDLNFSLSLSGTAATAAATAPTTSGPNLVQNGDFSANHVAVNLEQLSGNGLTGWQINGETQLEANGKFGATSQEIDLSGYNDNANSGIQQTLNTVAGQKYQVSFEVYTGAGSGYGQGSVNASFGSSTLGTNLTGANVTDLNNGRVRYTYEVTATGNSTDLKFGWGGTTTGTDPGAVAQIGNVSVLAVNSAPTAPVAPVTTAAAPVTANGLIDLRGYTGNVQTNFGVGGSSSNTNTAGLYRVDDAQGGIDVSGNGTNILHAGDAGYVDAAIARSVVSFTNQDTSATTTLQGGSLYASYQIVKGTTTDYATNLAKGTFATFGFQNANPDNFNHLQVTGNTFRYEDGLNGGDQDFNDTTFSVNVTGTLATTPTAPVTTTTLGANIVQNGGFEANTFTSTGNAAGYAAGTAPWQDLSGNNTLTGWQVNGSVAGLTKGYSGTGSQAIDLSGGFDNNASSGIKQTLDTVAGQTYRVSFDVFTGDPSLSTSGTVNASFGSASYAGLTGGSITENNGRKTYTFDVVATGNKTDLNFGWGGQGTIAEVDNVAVQSVTTTGGNTTGTSNSNVANLLNARTASGQPTTYSGGYGNYTLGSYPQTVATTQTTPQQPADTTKSSKGNLFLDPEGDFLKIFNQQVLQPLGQTIAKNSSSSSGSTSASALSATGGSTTGNSAATLAQTTAESLIGIAQIVNGQVITSSPAATTSANPSTVAPASLSVANLTGSASATKIRDLALPSTTALPLTTLTNTAETGKSKKSEDNSNNGNDNSDTRKSTEATSNSDSSATVTPVSSVANPIDNTASAPVTVTVDKLDLKGGTFTFTSPNEIIHVTGDFKIDGDTQFKGTGTIIADGNVLINGNTSYADATSSLNVQGNNETQFKNNAQQVVGNFTDRNSAGNGKIIFAGPLTNTAGSFSADQVQYNGNANFSNVTSVAAVVQPDSPSLDPTVPGATTVVAVTLLTTANNNNNGNNVNLQA